MRTALYIYCLVGVLLLLVAVVLTAAAAVGVNLKIEAAYTEWGKSKERSQAAESAYSEMEAEQRANRALYTPEQAVQASYAVQAAQEAMLTARQETDALQANVAQLNTIRDRYAIALIPLIVFMLAHAFVAFMLFPRKAVSQPSWRQKR